MYRSGPRRPGSLFAPASRLLPRQEIESVRPGFVLLGCLAFLRRADLELGERPIEAVEDRQESIIPFNAVGQDVPDEVLNIDILRFRLGFQGFRERGFDHDGDAAFGHALSLSEIGETASVESTLRVAGGLKDLNGPPGENCHADMVRAIGAAVQVHAELCHIASNAPT